MKAFQLGLLVVALLVGALLGASQALAANGLPSDTTLVAMGLSDLRVMTDSEGLAVRGLGYNGASAYGKSWASISGHGASAGSVNGYKSSGKYVAGGHNYSEAGIEIKSGGSHNGGGYGNNSMGGHGNNCNSCQPKSIKIKVFAGGSSGGFRK